jgi:hypothetical protein
MGRARAADPALTRRTRRDPGFSLREVLRISKHAGRIRNMHRAVPVREPETEMGLNFGKRMQIDPTPVHEEDFVNDLIEEVGHDGQIEELTEKLEKLTEIVSAMFVMLSNHQKIEIADTFGFRVV